MALVEGAGVRAVQVAHPVGEVGKRRLDDQVIVVPHQATGVDAPLVAAPDPAEDVEEDRAVPIVDDDRRMVVSPRPDVVVGTGGEKAARSRHVLDRSPSRLHWSRAGRFDTGPAQPRYVPGTSLASVGHRLAGRVRRGRVLKCGEKRVRPRLWSVPDAGARGSSRAPAAESADTACPFASSPGTARRPRPAHPPRSAPR